MPSEPAVRLALAQAVTDDARVRFLNERNQVVRDADKPRWMPLERAVRDDLAFFVRPREQILACDFDQHDARVNAEKLHLELLLAGYSPVLLDSGGGSAGRESRAPRAHLFARIDDAVDRERFTDRARDLGGDVRRGNSGIRPPMTLHSNGASRSLLRHPEDASEVLRRLTATTKAEPFGARIRQLIYEEPQDQGARSEAIFDVVTSLIRRGWTQGEVLLLLHSDGPLAITLTYQDAVQHRSDRDDRWLRNHVWRGAAERAKQRPEAVQRIQQLRTLARRRNGRSGFTPSVVLVYLALLDRAERVGALRIGMSRRDINETTGLGSAATVTRALAFLREEGLIRRVWDVPNPTGIGSDYDEPGRPSAIYELLSPDDLTDSTEPTPRLDAGGSVTFKNGAGYGQGARLTYYELLWAGPTRSDDLASARGIGPHTTRGHLRVLKGLGLVDERDGLWSATGLSPENVSPEEALERQRRMKDRHDLERQGYRRALAADA